jgi:tetratricopeptide (TPR) repeat protein
LVKKNYIQVLIVKNQLDQASKLNDEVLKARPGDVEAQITKGDIEIRSGKAREATETLQNALKTDPDNGIGHYQLGLAFDLMGNTSRAQQEWHDATRLRPDFVDAHRALAAAAIRGGDASALAQEANQIISLQPTSPDGYLWRAIAELDRKQYTVADDFIRQALEKDPKNTAAYVQRGNIRMVQKQWAEAQKAYQQALDIDPNSTDAMGGVLNTYTVQKQPDKALAVASAQSAKYPNNPGFHIMTGQILLSEKKDPAGAEKEFRRALEVDHNNVEATVKLGLVQKQQGAVDQSLQTYLDGIKTNPKVALYYLLAGGAYQDKQEWDKAKQMYQKALDLEPNNAVASNNLAYVMLQQGGNVDVALAMAQTARRELPDNPNSADTLGWAYYQKGVYSSAINLCKEAVSKDKENLVFNYHLGMAYAKAGQAGLARQQLDRLGKIKPNSSEADDLRRELAQAKS